MSKELTNIMEGVVGSAEYIRSINCREDFSCIITQNNKYNYYDMIKELCTRINSAFEEIYNDLGNQASIVRYIPSDKRKKVVGFINNISKIGDSVGYSFGKKRDIISILELSSSDVRTKSGVSDYYLDKSYEILNRGGSAGMSTYNGLELLRKAINNGVDSAAGNDEKNKTFLSEILKDAGCYQKEYLQDIRARYEYMNNPSSFKGRNGIELCSDNYIDYYIKYIFGKSFSRDKDFLNGVIKAAGRLIVTLGYDLENGIKNNDYIKDGNAARILDIIKEQERFGTNLSALKEKAEKLSWFVGGDEHKIKQLQKNLNELGIKSDSGKLLEDGVYGRETLSAWGIFVKSIIGGPVPTLNWVGEREFTKEGLVIGSSRDGTYNTISKFNYEKGKPGFQYFRVDPPHPNKGIDYNHININFKSPMTEFQENIYKNYNHYPLSDGAYNTLKNLKNVAKKVKIAGKVLLIAGIALDTLELGFAIYDDLHDVDKKLGKQTAQTVIVIGSWWAGAILGAEIGALIGSAIPVPVVGTAVGFTSGFILGIVGGHFGGKLGEYIVDITVAEG